MLVAQHLLCDAEPFIVPNLRKLNPPIHPKLLVLIPIRGDLHAEKNSHLLHPIVQAAEGKRLESNWK